MKVGRVKDPLYKDSYLGITPPLEPFENRKGAPHRSGKRDLGGNTQEWSGDHGAQDVAQGHLEITGLGVELFRV